jgi:hypothetical protein
VYILHRPWATGTACRMGVTRALILPLGISEADLVAAPHCTVAVLGVELLP